MKRITWIIPLFIILGCSKGKKVEVSGTIKNNSYETIYLDEQGVSEIIQKDSAKVKKNGHFKLVARIQNPTFFNLHPGTQEIIPLLLHPGDQVEVQTRFPRFASGYRISGSDESREIKELNETLSRTRHSLDSLRKLLEKDTLGDSVFLSGINNAYQEIIRDQRTYSTKFVLDHLTSMVSIYALYQKINDADYVLNKNRDIQLLKITAQALDTIYPESVHVKALKQNAAQLERNLYLQRFSEMYPNSESTLPDIRLPDPNGDTISFLSLKGKVVLLSFWASWDEASVARNLQLKRIYERHHSQGFEIFQVSFDYEREQWLKAIQFDELPWINVSELSYPKSRVASLYNVRELPADYLIGREGDIISKNNSIASLNNLIPKLLD